MQQFTSEYFSRLEVKAESIATETKRASTSSGKSSLKVSAANVEGSKTSGKNNIGDAHKQARGSSDAAGTGHTVTLSSNNALQAMTEAERTSATETFWLITVQC